MMIIKKIEVVIITILLLLLYNTYGNIDIENSTKNDIENNENENNNNNNNNNQNNDNNYESIWDPFIEFEDNPNVIDSYNLLKNLKFKKYWDLSKNKFRYGLIGHDLADSTPNAVIYTDMVLKNSAIVKDVPVVDLNFLLSNAIIVMKDISLNRYSIIDSKIDNLIKTQEDIMNKLLPLKEKLYDKDYISSKDIQAMLQILKLKHEKLDIQIETEKRRLILDIENSNYKKEKRFVLHNDFHNRLSNLTEQSQKSIDSLNEEKIKKMLENAENEAAKEIEINQKLQEMNLEMQIGSLKNEEKSFLDIIKFRYLEEARIERENEAVNNRIMSAKDEYALKGLDEVIVTVFDELSMQALTAMQDYNTVFLWVSRLFLIIIAIAVLYELVVSLGNFSSYFSKKSILRKFIPQRSKKTDFGNLILDEDTLDRFESFVKQLHAAVAVKSCLPNLLITGIAGVGKSVSAVNIAMLSGISYVTICEADLETMGSKAGLYLRELFRTKLKMVVIIDGADMLLNDRNYSTHNNSILRNCFHVILDAIRSGSSNFCLIITTQKSINQIDGAILDRIDSIVTLSLPTHSKRLEFIMIKIDEHLVNLLEPRALEIISTLMPKDEHGVWRNRGQTSLYKSLLGTVEKKSVGSSGKRGIDPENDRPSNNDLDDCSKRDSKSGIDFGFHVVKCIVELVNGSEGWSYREIEKFILCIRAEALGSNSCLVCQSEWMKELKRRKIHSPRSPSGSRR